LRGCRRAGEGWFRAYRTLTISDAISRSAPRPIGTGGLQTLCWREMDSSGSAPAATPLTDRGVKPQATAAGCHFGEILPQGATLMMALSVSLSRPLSASPDAPELEVRIQLSPGRSLVRTRFCRRRALACARTRERRRPRNHTSSPVWRDFPRVAG
jgi:hypothetical protein